MDSYHIRPYSLWQALSLGCWHFFPIYMWWCTKKIIIKKITEQWYDIITKKADIKGIRSWFGLLFVFYRHILWPHFKKFFSWFFIVYKIPWLFIRLHIVFLLIDHVLSAPHYSKICCNQWISPLRWAKSYLLFLRGSCGYMCCLPPPNVESVNMNVSCEAL